jgi:NADPH:quinone reductase-like Zn-dependent oxidoreductase
MAFQERAIMTETMKAAILETYGKPFRIVDIPVPAPGPGDVLVRIAASSVNPLDTKIHAGGGACPPFVAGDTRN